MDSADPDTSLPGADDWCPAAPLLTLLRGRWTASLLYYLGARGPARFGELQRELAGISPKVLTARLRGLERDGLLWREASGGAAPEVRYGLSEMGVDVHAALSALEEPTERWLTKPGTGPAR